MLEINIAQGNAIHLEQIEELMSGRVLIKFLARIRMGTWSRCTTLTWNMLTSNRIHSIHLQQQVDALLQPRNVILLPSHNTLHGGQSSINSNVSTQRSCRRLLGFSINICYNLQEKYIDTRHEFRITKKIYSMDDHIKTKCSML